MKLQAARTLIIIWFLLIAMLPTNTVQAANTTFYIDNRPGSRCTNAGAGTSASAPWCDFTNINSRTFGPGDQI